MKRLIAILGTAAILNFISANQSVAFEREVNNVWWDVYEHYNGGDQTACITENYNNFPVQAVFETRPHRWS